MDSGKEKSYLANAWDVWTKLAEPERVLCSFSGGVGK